MKVVDLKKPDFVPDQIILDGLDKIRAIVESEPVKGYSLVLAHADGKYSSVTYATGKGDRFAMIGAIEALKMDLLVKEGAIIE